MHVHGQRDEDRPEQVRRDIVVCIRYEKKVVAATLFGGSDVGVHATTAN